MFVKGFLNFFPLYIRKNMEIAVFFSCFLNISQKIGIYSGIFQEMELIQF